MKSIHGRFPGLYLLITGTPAFFRQPSGNWPTRTSRPALHVDFTTDAKYDNPRAIQLRLPAFDLDRLCLVGTRIRDIYLQHAKSSARIADRCDDQYVRSLAEAVTGKLGGKVGVAPRIFLKKLVADVLDRVDLHEGSILGRLSVKRLEKLSSQRSNDTQRLAHQ